MDEERKEKRKVLFNKTSALFWLVLGIISFPLGWASSVALVWIASVYANVKTDWGTAEAADNRQVLKELREIKALLNELKARETREETSTDLDRQEDTQPLTPL